MYTNFNPNAFITRHVITPRDEVLAALGYHSFKTLMPFFIKGTLIAHVTNGILNFFGYISLIGTICGIFRLILLAIQTSQGKIPNACKAYKISVIVRSCIETFSCGFLFIIPDLIVTIGRFSR